MNERKINVLEVGEYKKNLEDVTHYIDDCINRIYGGIKALTSQNIIEGEISNTLENAYEELSKIRTEVNEELDSFTGWIGKNIEDTTLLDERHARELENELNSMEFFKDGYTISGGNAFLTGDNNMKFNSPNGTTKEYNSSKSSADNNKEKDNNSKDSDKKSEENGKNSSNNKATDSNSTKVDTTDKDNNSNENNNYKPNNSTEVNDNVKSRNLLKEYNDKVGVQNTRSTDFANLVEINKDNFTLKDYKEFKDIINSGYTGNLPIIKETDSNGNLVTPSSIKDFAKMRLSYTDNFNKDAFNSTINQISDDKLRYQFVETYEIDGQKKSFSYFSKEIPTYQEHYDKVYSFLEQNANSNSQIIRDGKDSGINLVEID